MRCSEIVKSAWKLTDVERGLIWYGIIPAFFSTLAGIAYFTYQFLAFRASPFFGGKEIKIEAVKETVLGFTHLHPTIVLACVIFAIIAGVAYFLLPPFFEGGLIGLVAAIRREKEVKASDGIAIGANNYLKMFELGMVLGSFSLIEFATILSLTIRKFGIPSWVIVLLTFIFIITFILSFLFIYTPQFLILEKRSIVGSMMGSANLVISNFGKTLLMWLLMLLISVRVIINVFLIFLIPAFIVVVANFFVTKIVLWLGIILAILVGILVLLLASYLAGVLHTFSTSAWVITFLSLDHNRAEKLLEK